MTPATGGDGRAAAPPIRLTIGKVLAAIGEDFPDVTASKLRFLEAEGLVTPERTASGYRTYAAADLDRIRFVLAAQRDRFWPLKVIRDALDAMDRGLADPGPDGGLPRVAAPSPDPSVPTGAALAQRNVVSVTGPELREATGIDRETFHALETYGLLQADANGHFDAEALSVAGAAHALAEHGLEPRHLRPFRTAADREIGLVEQVLATRRAGGTRDERAADILSACLALHVALVRSGLRH